MTYIKDQRGIAIFLTVLVMGTISLSVLIGLTQGSVNAVVESHQESDAILARANAYSCMDEAFIQLVGDIDWSPATVIIPDGTCNVTVVPTGLIRDILVTTTAGDVTRGVTANVTLTPFIINDIEEALSL